MGRGASGGVLVARLQAGQGELDAAGARGGPEFEIGESLWDDKASSSNPSYTHSATASRLPAWPAIGMLLCVTSARRTFPM